jgi:hypothetical protein
LAIYTFKLEKFRIDNTRSRHDDTDKVFFGIQVGARQFPAQSYFAGNLNNGEYPVPLEFDSVFVSNAATPVVISYQIYNGDMTKVAIDFSKLNIDLGEQAVEFVKQKVEQGDPGDYTDFSSHAPQGPSQDNINFVDGTWLGFLEFVSLGSFLFPDCDGFVAVGTLGKPKNSWDALIDSAGGDTLRSSIRYPGTDSPAGCGSNSDYTVTWSLTRRRVAGPRPHSLRKFLRDNQISLNPGIRSLDSVNPGISISSLLN